MVTTTILGFLYFALGYQTHKLIREREDEKFLQELKEALYNKIAETDIANNNIIVVEKDEK